MANEEQLSILKQGVEVWNKWREENPNILVDLSRADLSATKLWNADLTGANLRESNLSRADLGVAQLYRTSLMDADLSGANLTSAYLHSADMTRADLRGANLTLASSRSVDFTGADLLKADLRGAYLQEASFARGRLAGAIFIAATLSGTKFSYVDLSEALNLEDVVHAGPSSIGTDTLVRSKGNIPEVFLRGCGLSDWEIEQVKLYNADLSNDKITQIQYKIYDLRATQALQISPLFISYSHGDIVFVDKLESQLNDKGIRFWRDIHDLKAGRIETQIDRAISQNRTVLLILSKNSIKSDWVEHEVRTARGVEKELGRDALCPVALDESWKSSPWPKRVMEQIMEYNILDFSAWEDDDKFNEMFRKLIDGLELFYKG